MSSQQRPRDRFNSSSRMLREEASQKQQPTVLGSTLAAASHLTGAPHTFWHSSYSYLSLSPLCPLLLSIAAAAFQPQSHSPGRTRHSCHIGLALPLNRTSNM